MEKFRDKNHRVYIKVQYRVILVGLDLGEDNIGLGFINILFKGDQLRKQWPSPDTMLMKIDKGPCTQKANSQGPGNKN
jgi:hypothetical protein